MSKIKVKKIEDPNTEVPIHSAFDRIEAIKAEISGFTTAPHLAEVEVFDMWGDSSAETS
ncbi:MAG: hypothetical protein WCT32_05530 [Patescibacteria group bacterium]|jgi:hypothetical protein